MNSITASAIVMTQKFSVYIKYILLCMIILIQLVDIFVTKVAKSYKIKQMQIKNFAMTGRFCDSWSIHVITTRGFRNLKSVFPY